MGVYIYTVKRSTLRQVKMAGKSVEMALLAYHYKMSLSWRSADALWRGQVEVTREAWAGETPEFVILSDTYEEGAPVRTWPKGQITWTDTEAVPGVLVGHLHQVGRRWEVVPVEAMAAAV